MVRATFSLSFLMGITWTVGLTLLASEDDILQFVFVVLNSTQGLFIFFFHATIARHSLTAPSLLNRQSTEYSLVITLFFNVLKQCRWSSFEPSSNQRSSFPKGIGVGEGNTSSPTHRLDKTNVTGRGRVTFYTLNVGGLENLPEGCLPQIKRHNLKVGGESLDVGKEHFSASPAALSLQSTPMRKSLSFCNQVGRQTFRPAVLQDEGSKSGQALRQYTGRHSWPILPKYEKLICMDKS